MFKISSIIALALFLGMATSAWTEEKPTAMWKSGNAFLTSCDESNPLWMGNSWDSKNKELQLFFCDFWLIGIQQGASIVEQIRPPQKLSKLSPAEEKASQQETEWMRKRGIHGLVFSDRNSCVPDLQTDQLRLVVIKWMKDHPTDLEQSGAGLAYAALQSTYTCK